MIDGVQTRVCVRTEDGAFLGSALRAGFYSYEIDGSGVYWLTAFTRVQTDELRSGDLYNGKLYTAYADGITIGNTIVDRSGTGRAGSLDSIESLLDEGAAVTITYVYKTSGGSRLPVGVVYVMQVVFP